MTRAVAVATGICALALCAPASAATFTVTSTSDAIDTRPGDGRCSASNGRCTLRAAIGEANARPGADTVVVRAGTYALARTGSGPDGGDHDISGPLTLTGAGATSTVLDGGPRPAGAPPEFRGLDRLLEIHPGAGDVTVMGLTLRDGSTAGDGGALLNASLGRLRLDRVAVITSFAGGGGGGLRSSGPGGTEVRRSTFSGNVARGDGGAIALAGAFGAGATVIENSTLSGNAAAHGGGLFTAGGAVSVESATIAANSALGASALAGPTGPIVLGAGLRNTLLAGATPACSGAVASAGGNVENGSSCALTGPADRSDADPRLDPLAANGGPTQTHALRRGSAALDSGVSPCPVTDQRGAVRPQGPACDSGAFEATPFAPDTLAPETQIVRAPAPVSGELDARFEFTGADNETPAAALSFECRLDGTQTWSPCASPALYTGLAQGPHAFEVRATDGAGNTDATPARHTWTIDVCGAANTTLTAVADTWLDEASPQANKGSDATLMLRTTAGAAARVLVRFPLPARAPEGCVVESAKLRLYAPSGSEGSVLEARRATAAWNEGTVSWSDQPETAGSPGTAYAGDGIVTWNVGRQVQAVLDGAPGHGFLIRDAGEGLEGGGNSEFHSREKGESPPLLQLRFAPPPTGTPPPPAAPVEARVTCGEELTRSTLVTNDLADCLTSDGLVIGAHRIIVDLGGHTIDGVGLGTGVRNDGYSGVIIRNGRVREWDHGVQLQTATTAGVVRNLTAEANEVTGIQLSAAGAPGASGIEVRDNTVVGNGAGIALLAGTTNTLVAGNSLASNGGAHLLVQDSTANRLERNTIAGEGGGDLGIGIENSTGNTVLQNTVSATSDGGLIVSAGSHDNRVEGNVLTGTGDAGILVELSDRNELIGNKATEMSDSGIVLSDANDGLVKGNEVGANPGGIQVDGSSGNLIQANNASATTGIGIELGGGALDNRVIENRADGNGAAGILVAEEALLAPGNLIERNSASNNGGDGIETAKGGHTLTGNVAEENGGWGIDAALGTIDGGGNVARGNFEPTQCLGIVCLGDAAPPPPDGEAPETAIDSAPAVSDGRIEISFSAVDDVTPAGSLRFECRLDELAFEPCTSPRLYTGLEPGPHTFAVRAVDLAGNADATPAEHAWVDESDDVAPETRIDVAPSDGSLSRVGFSFSGSDVQAGALTFECQVDTIAFWEPCASPHVISDLAAGPHQFRVRAVDASGNVDATPAAHSWSVAAGAVCPDTVDAVADADAWIDENSGDANKGTDSILKLQSKAPSDDFRALVRFPLTADPPAGCTVASATLRVFATSATEGRRLQAIRLAAAWDEQTVTWDTQPAVAGPAAETQSGEGYREWDVTAQVQAMLESGERHGFLIRDAIEGGEGGEQGLHSREKGEDPPRLLIRFTAG